MQLRDHGETCTTEACDAPLAKLLDQLFGMMHQRLVDCLLLTVRFNHYMKVD